MAYFLYKKYFRISLLASALICLVFAKEKSFSSQHIDTKTIIEEKISLSLETDDSILGIERVGLLYEVHCKSRHPSPSGKTHYRERATHLDLFSANRLCTGSKSAEPFTLLQTQIFPNCFIAKSKIEEVMQDALAREGWSFGLCKNPQVSYQKTPQGCETKASVECPPIMIWEE